MAPSDEFWPPAAAQRMLARMKLGGRFPVAFAAAQWLAVLLIVTAGSSAAARGGTEFRYDRVGERRCASSRRPINPEWSNELEQRLPEFRAIWESMSPGLVEAVVTLTTKRFSSPALVRLTLCPVPSNSFFGVTVNMRYALRSFSTTPVPLRYKADTVFHEALHGFVSKNTPGDSSLLKEHAAESPCVRNHLHLLALQKAALLQTQDLPSLEQVISIDSQLPSDCYGRAWSLVNATPSTYQRYVAELSR